MNMYQGNWKCSTCGVAITELPFQPRSETGLTCRACWSKQNNKTAHSTPETVTAPEVPDDIPEDAGLASEPMGDDPFAGMETLPVTPGEKPKFTGDWQCATCGGSITSLPFNPRSTDNLKCLDCFKQSKG